MPNPMVKNWSQTAVRIPGTLHKDTRQARVSRGIKFYRKLEEIYIFPNLTLALQHHKDAILPIKPGHTVSF
jgi:hypothetical protein